MAFTIQSVGTSAGALSTTTCVITKPTGVAVGDILVAHMYFPKNGTPAVTAVTPPSGWTEIGKPTGVNGIMYTAWKAATATEVSASDFTFTANQTADASFGKILRLNGGRESNVAYAKASAGLVSGTTITVGTITPSVANSLLLFFTAADKGGLGAPSFSSQAIATSDPSWTEAYDSGYSNTVSIGLACAYATRPETTATGDATATISATLSGAGTIIAIEPQITATATDSVTPADTFLAGMSTIQTETVTPSDDIDTVAGEWMNTDKNTSAWTNTDKS